MRRLPSVKTLEAAFPGKGKVLRQLLENKTAVDAHPAVIAWENQCYHRPNLRERRLCAINAELEGFGVEYIEPGMAAKDYAFEYINMGNSDNVTICRMSYGTYRICSWSDIVDRGKYS